MIPGESVVAVAVGIHGIEDTADGVVELVEAGVEVELSRGTGHRSIRAHRYGTRVEVEVGRAQHTGLLEPIGMVLE